VLSIVPPKFSCTLQVTAVLVVPVTVAAKDCVAPCNTVAELGVTVTLMSRGGGVGVDEEVALPPHPETPIIAAITRAMTLG
jgi:hypothetical protein